MLATLENVGKRRKLLATREDAEILQVTKAAEARRQALKFVN